VGNGAVTRLVVQRDGPADPTCPKVRPPGEREKSGTAEGILATDVTLNEADRTMAVQDFPVNGTRLPADLTTSPAWQRVMSLIIGDRTSGAFLAGFTDCVGTGAENLDLRRRRVEALVAAMPAAARARVQFSTTFGTGDFLDTNATATGRARNRAVVLRFTPDRTVTPAEQVPKAANIDEYLFLVRTVERKLSLTTPADAPKVLSLLRQIYYGTATWSDPAKSNPQWDAVITQRPWSPGTDPTPQLGASLVKALRESDTPEAGDLGHVLVGLDAMLAPSGVKVPGLINQTTVLNEAFGTWAGDVGAAAAEWTMDTMSGSLKGSGDGPTYMHRQAGQSDLNGDIDAFAIRAGLNNAGPAQLGRAIKLSRRLSDIMMDYFRITHSALGQANARPARLFVEAHGGKFAGGALTNRPALEATLRTQVLEMATLFNAADMYKRGTPPWPGDAYQLRAAKCAAGTTLFVDWLLQKAHSEPA
jgi:hypothetical protein